MANTEPTATERPAPARVGDWVRLHLWQIQPIRDIVLVGALFGILWAGYTASIVTVPLLLAMLLAYLVEPMVRVIAQGSRKRRRLAAGGIILCVIVFVAVPVIFASIWATTSAIAAVGKLQHKLITFTEVVAIETPLTDAEIQEKLPGRTWQSAARILRGPTDHPEPPPAEPPSDGPAPSDADELPPPTTGGPASADATDPANASDNAEVEPELVGSPAKGMREVVISAAKRAGAWAKEHWAEADKEQLARETGEALVSAAASGFDALTIFASGAKRAGLLVFGTFLTAFFFFFICSGYQHVLQSLRNLIPDKSRERVLYLASRMDRVVAGFVRGRLLICVIMGILFTIGYILIGTPMPLLLGFATGMLSIVPYLALVTVPVAVLLMLLDPVDGFRGAWWWSLGAPWALYFLIQAADDYLLTPRIQGKQTDMDTPSILFATLAGAALFGVYGLLLAIPLAACTKILWIEAVLPRVEKWKKGRVADPLPIGGAPPPLPPQPPAPPAPPSPPAKK